MGSIGGVNAHVSTTEKSSTIRTQVTEKITEKLHGKVDETLKSAGVSEETRDVLLADVPQLIDQQMSSGGRPDPRAMRESISDIFEKHGLSLPKGSGQVAGKLGFPGGYSGPGAADISQLDAVQSLIKRLQDENNGSDDNKTKPGQYARELVDGYFGVDFSA